MPSLVQYTFSANSKHQLDFIQWKAFSGLSYYMVTATTTLAGDTEVLHVHESTAWLARDCFMSPNTYDVIHANHMLNDSYLAI